MTTTVPPTRVVVREGKAWHVQIYWPNGMMHEGWDAGSRNDANKMADRFIKSGQPELPKGD